MEFIALDNLYGGLDPLHHAVGKGLSGVAAIDQLALDPFQIRLAAVDGPQSAVAVRDICRGHGDGVGQALRIHPNVTFDARYLLARVVALYSFLQIRPRDGHPCRSANTSPCRVCRGLATPSECALPGAPRKRASALSRCPL